MVQRGPQAARELELLRAAGPARDLEARCPSGPASPASSSASVAVISCSSSVQSTELAKSIDSAPPWSLIDSGVTLTIVWQV